MRHIQVGPSRKTKPAYKYKVFETTQEKAKFGTQLAEGKGRERIRKL